MQPTDDDLKVFAALWKEEFQETITEADARTAASSLMEFYTMLASPVEDQ
jgi:hypothetical protein